MRELIRFSLNSDTNSVLRKQIATKLKRAGFATGAGSQQTDTWQAHEISADKFGASLKDFWDTVNGKPEVNAGRFWSDCDG